MNRGNYRVGDNTRLWINKQFHNVLEIKYTYSFFVCPRSFINNIM